MGSVADLVEDLGRLGETVKRYDIAEYTFLEYYPRDDRTATKFSCYRDGKRLGYSANSLDMALVIAIAHKYDGLNSQAAHYFGRMVGMEG